MSSRPIPLGRYRAPTSESVIGGDVVGRLCPEMPTASPDRMVPDRVAVDPQGPAAASLAAASNRSSGTQFARGARSWMCRLQMKELVQGCGRASGVGNDPGTRLQARRPRSSLSSWAGAGGPATYQDIKGVPTSVPGGAARLGVQHTADHVEQDRPHRSGRRWGR